MSIRDVPLDPLPKDFLVGLRFLRGLGLINAGLHTIPSDLFTPNPYLTAIDFSGNKLTSLDPVLFASLNIRNVPISDLPSILRNCRSLGFLQITGSKIEILLVFAFQGLFRLSIVILRSNRITSVHTKAFFGLKHLRKVDLSNNKIRDLEFDLFKGMVFPKDLLLNLENNPLSFDQIVPYLVKYDKEVRQSVSVDKQLVELGWVNNLRARTTLDRRRGEIPRDVYEKAAYLPEVAGRQIRTRNNSNESNETQHTTGRFLSPLPSAITGGSF